MTLSRNITQFLVIFLIYSFAESAENCIFEDDTGLYDLRPLGERDYWFYEDTTHYENFNIVYYLSVCHPLTNVPNGKFCSQTEGTAVCLQKINQKYLDNFEDRYEETVLPNAGSVFANGSVESIKTEEQGWVTYTYNSGMQCRSENQQNYTTILNLICPFGSYEESSSPILMDFADCELSFGLVTNAACPIKVVERTGTCEQTFPGTNQILNLRSLHSDSYYSVSPSSYRVHPETKYELNICGPIKNGSCADPKTTLCEVTEGSEPKVISTSEDMEVRWRGPIITLRYNKMRSDQKNVHIDFTCSRDAHGTDINYIKNPTQFVVFTVNSHALCPPKRQDCIIRDKKNRVFDLRPLHKKTGNWKVLDNRRDYQDVLYHMNVCGPLNDGGTYDCPTNGVGVCQTSISRRSAYNLGLMSSDPQMNSDGSISILYTGGTPCKNNKFVRSTRLNLFCSNAENGPEFIDESSTCEYVFQWFTPAACPRHTTTSMTCQVTDPLYGNTFDLNPLRNDLKDYFTSGIKRSFYLNMCGPVVGTDYFLDSDASVVMTTDDSPDYTIIGEYPGQLTFNDGTLMQTFKSSSVCKGNATYSSTIVYMCDHNATEPEGLSVYYTHHSSCDITFFFRTKHACPPHNVIDCTVTTDNGTKYDLNSLSLSNLNHETFQSSRNIKFVFNVCRQIVHAKTARCPYNSASCRIDTSHRRSSTSLGVVNSGPTMENGMLKIKYHNGDKCNVTHRFSTEIIFVCDKEKIYSEPLLIANSDCKYIFEYRGFAACPVVTKSITSQEKCKFTSANGHVFDFSPLEKSGGYVLSKGKTLLKINICAPVPSCPSENDGACYSDNGGEWISTGRETSEITKSHTALMLKYNGGYKCKNGLRATTLISFYCGSEESARGPAFLHIDETTCNFFVNWNTDLACESETTCVARGTHGNIDLSSLVKHYDNYEVRIPNTTKKFYLNLCSPLNHVSDLHCGAGSSACLVDSKNESIEATSIGRPLQSPQMNGKSVKILYSDGEKCDSPKFQTFSTEIHLICDRSAGTGHPKYSHLSGDCKYIFRWRTSFVCPKKSLNYDETCRSYKKISPTVRRVINMYALHKPEGYRVPFGSRVFHVNICGTVCSEDSVCTDDDISFGHTSHSELEWVGNILQMIHYGGDKCPSALVGKRSSVINFVCDRSAGLGAPEADPIMDELDCRATFTWRTDLICFVESPDYTTVSSTALPSTTVPSTTTLPPTTTSPDAQDNTQSEGHGKLITILVLVIFSLILIIAYLYRYRYFERFIRWIRIVGVYPSRCCCAGQNGPEEMRSIV